MATRNLHQWPAVVGLSSLVPFQLPGSSFAERVHKPASELISSAVAGPEEQH